MSSQSTVDLNQWPIFARKVAAPSEPEEYCEAAVDRLMLNISDYVTYVKNVRPQFRAHNSIKLIDFASDRQRIEYANAYKEWLELRAKLEGGTIISGAAKMQKLVADKKFHQKAEYLKHENIADEMHYGVTHRNVAAVCACNYQATIAGAVNMLNRKYGVDRSQISIIWGGDKRYDLAHTKVVPDEVIIKTLTDQALGRAVDRKLMKQIRLQLEAKVLELDKIPAELRLGKQSKAQRQDEIDRFQAGKSLYCFFTYKSGGIGLSLHHTDEMTKQKARLKPSGFVFEEDIPLIPTRQREVILATTWSDMELVQGLGRVPRLTSLSDTYQCILFFRNTIEVAIARRVSVKLKCLRKVVRNPESWEDAIWEYTKSDPTNEERLITDEKPTADEDDENNDILMGDIELGDDEEEEDEDNE